MRPWKKARPPTPQLRCRASDVKKRLRTVWTSKSIGQITGNCDGGKIRGQRSEIRRSDGQKFVSASSRNQVAAATIGSVEFLHHKRPMMQCYLCMPSRNCCLTIRKIGIVFEEAKLAKNRRKNHESSADRALRK